MRLSPAEREVLDFFVHMGKYLSLPRSVGEIYGLLFARVERLQSWHNKARRLMPLVSTFLKM